MYTINSLTRVHAGRQGETGLRRVAIDCTAWTEAYPGLTIALVAIRPGETEPYVPTGVTLSDGILTWIPNAVDTAIAGTGLLGIQGTDASEHVIKSAKTTYVVESAVDTPQGYVPPEPEESWLAHAEAVLQDMLDRLAAQSAGTITDWLEENITQETGYVIDTSLTVQNAAADAKAVGDTIGALLETVTYTMTASGDWRKGYYQRSDGAYTNRNYFMCTGELIDLGGVTHVSVQPPEGYNASLTLYDAAGTLQSVVGYVDSQSYPAQAGVPQESDARPYAQLGISIGRFVNNDAATYAADPAFTGTIEITVTRLRQVEAVTDVQVNGSSVVSGGVANIAMPTTSQWELIREETVINATEADIVISADTNGQSFELTDVRLVFITPQQDTAAAKADYGRVRFYYQAGAYDITFIGAYTQAAGAAAKVSYISFEQRDGMLTKVAMPNTSRGGMGPWQTYATEDGEGCFVLPDTPRLYNRVNITKVTGTAHYILYGKRKVV